jgi:hypothetical protein
MSSRAPGWQTRRLVPRFGLSKLPPHLLCPTGSELRTEVYQWTEEGSAPFRNYTFRSMLRRHASQATAAQPDAAPEAPRRLRLRKPGGLPAWRKRVSKRVVQKADGRYLIYYDKA